MLATMTWQQVVGLAHLLARFPVWSDALAEFPEQDSLVPEYWVSVLVSYATDDGDDACWEVYLDEAGRAWREVSGRAAADVRDGRWPEGKFEPINDVVAA